MPVPWGARWSSPFTTRLDIIDRGARPELLRYHGADGRTHEWPQPKVGAFHYDAIENVTLVRVAENSVAVCRGVETKETYERHGKHYRLVNITLRNGAAVALAYEHAGEANALTPSDLMSHHGDDIHAHVHTIADKTGHITQIWLIDEGKPVRQLAAYEYDEAGDLVSATDEHGAQRGYAYAHHLLTRYTDRTGRGMNLRWHGTEPTAKAVREWADDGSYDTKLEWDPDIRLTYVTDAHGNETWYYYDILGYTYRVRHADGLSEWFFRDAAKNVVRHLHTDGSSDEYTYDDRSNMVSHTRADGSTVHFAYDEQDNLLKIRDAEGGLWKRDYDQKGYLTQEKALHDATMKANDG
ncbi:RHS repeat domain-containing protein [Caballeronia sp. PC1]|uniref:RHS repeat domain-containing protein n=1 Tax=Caballeronia sp. PC1 TaxID=2906765 RepID=UPI001F1E32FA|nr:RHS repeat domain-containing protein [Caballeronia sp. PC1]MCE4544318.1 hypothetical protein [Caballeronia sp. PC1]